MFGPLLMAASVQTVDGQPNLWINRHIEFRGPKEFGECWGGWHSSHLTSFP